MCKVGPEIEKRRQNHTNTTAASLVSLACTEGHAFNVHSVDNTPLSGWKLDTSSYWRPPPWTTFDIFIHTFSCK